MSDRPFKLFDPDQIWSAQEDAQAVAPKYHRLRVVRQQQCMSLRDVAEKTETTVDQASREENGETDLPISRLFKWQRALSVPISDLLVSFDFTNKENAEQKSITRAIQLIRQILERSDSPGVRSMTEAALDEMVNLMAMLESAASKAQVKQLSSS